MSTCAKCGMPLEPNEPQCLYCGEPTPGAAKGSGPAPSSDAAAADDEGAPIAIASFDSVEEAEACKARLEAAGVNSLVDTSGGQSDFGNVGSGNRPIQLWVRDTDAEQAMSILSAEMGNGHVDAPEAPFHHEEMQEEVPDAAPIEDEVDEPMPAEESGRLHLGAKDEAGAGIGEVTEDPIRILESRLSALMDEHDTPGWEVNPANHPDVEAFIEKHSDNKAFVKKARGLQQNRASYYEAMKQRAGGDMAEAEPEAEAVADADDDVPNVESLGSSRLARTLGKPPAAAGKKRGNKGLLAAILVVPILAMGGYVGYTYFFAGDEGQQPKPPANNNNAGGPPGPVDGNVDQKLAEAVTAAGAKGPWQWNDVNGVRAAVPADANTAPKVTALATALNKAGIKPLPDTVAFLKGDPSVDLKVAQIRPLKKGAPQLPRILVRFQTLGKPEAAGRYADYPALMQALPWAISDRDVLLMHAAYKARFAQPDNGLLFIRLALGIGRSVGDDPSLAAQQFRLETRQLVVAALQRNLRWGQPAKDSLQTTQTLLEKEAPAPLLGYAVRGQRAFAQEVLSKLEATPGTPDPAALTQLAGAAAATIPPEKWQDAAWIKGNHAAILDLCTQLLDLETAPVADRAARLQAIGQAVKALTPEQSLAQAVVAPLVTFAHDFFVNQGALATAIVALAAERSRIDAGRFPRAPGELVQKKLVSQEPIDPLDPEPNSAIKIRAFDKGIMVYSVGLDGKDDKGKKDDVVFWLWKPVNRVR